MLRLLHDALILLVGVSLGYLGARLRAHSANASEGRALSTTTSECALDELVGITSPAVASAVRAEISHYRPPHSGNVDGELKRHYKSKAYLQDAFVRLHKFMWAAKLLPIVEWGKGRGLTAPRPPAWLLNASRVGHGKGYAGYHAGPSVIPRLAVNAFVLASAPRVAAGATCLGWDTTEYVDLVPGCARDKSWSLVFKAGGVRITTRQRTIHADIASLSEAASFASLPVRFDLVICQEVFEHVARPFDGARALYQLLRPGGLVFFTTPFNIQFHLVPTDFFRYTVDGAREILAAAGLATVAAYKVGDSAITSGFNLGFGAGDFDAEHLSRKLLQPVTEPVGQSRKWGSLRESLYVGVCVVAQRPPG